MGSQQLGATRPAPPGPFTAPASLLRKAAEQRLEGT